MFVRLGLKALPVRRVFVVYTYSSFEEKTEDGIPLFRI